MSDQIAVVSVVIFNV